MPPVEYCFPPVPLNWICLASSEWAAWVQAVGSILAIAGAFGVAHIQVLRQQRIEVERREHEQNIEADRRKHEGQIETERRADEVRGVLELANLLTHYVATLVRDLDVLARSSENSVVRPKAILRAHVGVDTYRTQFEQSHNDINKVAFFMLGRYVALMSELRAHLDAIPAIVDELRIALQESVDSAVNLQPGIVYRLKSIERARLRLFEASGLRTQLITELWVVNWDVAVPWSVTTNSANFPHSEYFAGPAPSYGGRSGPTLAELRERGAEAVADADWRKIAGTLGTSPNSG